MLRVLLVIIHSACKHSCEMSIYCAPRPAIREFLLVINALFILRLKNINIIY